jgi:hypothetical protein
VRVGKGNTGKSLERSYPSVEISSLGTYWFADEFALLTVKTKTGTCAHLHLSSAHCHLKNEWRYSPPVNKEQLLDLTKCVKQVAGVEVPSSSTHNRSRPLPHKRLRASKGLSSATLYY